MPGKVRAAGSGTSRAGRSSPGAGNPHQILPTGHDAPPLRPDFEPVDAGFAAFWRFHGTDGACTDAGCVSGAWGNANPADCNTSSTDANADPTYCNADPTYRTPDPTHCNAGSQLFLTCRQRAGSVPAECGQRAGSVRACCPQVKMIIAGPSDDKETRTKSIRPR